MSREIDERVVSLEFDNKNFEKNVNQTMKSLDSLNDKLEFKGSEKSFKDIEKAANAVSLVKLSDNIEQIANRFTTLGVIGTTVLQNITNKAVDAGTQFAKSLSIDQISSGFTKYEQKTSSIQTIVNATGKSIDEINGYLDELMWYSDETSYGFTDMTQSLAQLTSAGGDIKKLIPMIEGIANSVAYAGKGAAEFSRIIYNLNQSYSAGALQLMDWKSVELAGAGSKQLKKEFIEAAKAVGTLDSEGRAADGTLVSIGNFGSTLQQKWATTEVMEQAFGKFAEFTQAVHDAVENGTYPDATSAIEAMSGSYGEVSEESFKAAQQAKTFTKAIDATVDAVSSGWMNAIEKLFGSLDDATEIWSNFSNFLYEIFASDLGGLGDKIEEVMTFTGDSLWGSIYNKIKDSPLQDLLNENDAGNEAYKQISEVNDALFYAVGLTEEEVKLIKETFKESEKTGKSFRELMTEHAKEGSGREELFGSFENIGEAILQIIGTIKEAWSDVFPEASTENIYNVLKNINEFTKNLIADEGTLKNIRDAFGGIFSVISALIDIVTTPFRLAFDILSAILSSFNVDIAGGAASIGSFLKDISKGLKDILGYDNIIKYAKPLIDGIASGIKTIADALGQVLGSLPPISDLFSQIGDVVSSVWNNISGFFANLFGIATKEDGKFVTEGFSEGIQEGIKNTFDVVASWITGLVDKVKELLGIHSPSKVFMAIGGFCVAGFILGLKGDEGSIEDSVGNFANGILDSFENGVYQTLSRITNIAKNIVGTILNSITDTIATSISYFQTTFAQKGIDLGAIINGIFTSVSVVSIYKVSDAIQNISKGIAGFGEALEGVKNALTGVQSLLKSTGKLLKRTGRFLVGEGIKAQLIGLASVIGVLAASIIGISLVVDNIKNPNSIYIALVAIAGILIATVGMFEIIGHSKVNPKALVSFSALMVTFSLLLTKILIFSALITTDTDKLISVGTVIGGIAIIMVGIIWALSKITKSLNEGDDETKKADKAVWQQLINSIKVIAKSLLLLASAVTILSLLPIGTMWSAVGAMAVMSAVIIGMLAIMVKLTSSVNKGKTKKTELQSIKDTLETFSSTITSIATSVLIIAASILVLSFMSWDKMALGLTAMAGVFGILFLFFLVMGKTGANKTKLEDNAKQLMAMAGAVAALAGVALILSLVDPILLTKGELAVLGLLMMVSLFVIFIDMFTKTFNKDESSALSAGMKSLYGVAALIGVITICTIALGAIQYLVSYDKLVGGLVLIGLMMAGITIMMKQVSAIRNTSKFTMGALITISSAIVALTAMLGILAVLVDNPQKLAAMLVSAVAISGIMIAMGFMFKIVGKMGSIMPTAQKTMIIMSSCVLALVVALGALTLVASTNFVTLATAAVSIVGIMLALAFAFKIIATSSNYINPMAYITLCVLAILMGGLSIVMAGLANAAKDNPTSLLTAAAGLTLLLLAMVGILVALDKFVNIGLNDIGAFVGLGVLVVVIAILGSIISGLASIQNPDSVLPIAQSLSLLLIAMSGSLILLGLVGLMGPSALIGAGILVAFSALLPLIVQSLDSAASSLPSIAVSLSAFMTSLQPFIDGLSSIDANVLGNCVLLALALVAITAASLLNQIIGWISGDNPIDKFGEQLVSFGSYLVAFSDIVKGHIDESAVTAAANAGKMLAEMAATIPNSGGLAGAIFGENDVDDFGAKLVPFGTAMVRFSSIVAGKIDADAVTAAANAGRIMADMASTLPNSGGLAGWFMGENDMDQFGSQLVPFGTAIVRFSSIVAGKIDADAIESAANAGKTMAEMANTLPNSGGVLGFFAGENDMDQFGAQLVPFGTAMVRFSSIVAGKIDPDAVSSAANAGKIMSEMASTIPNSGGVAGFFAGENDMDQFGTKLVPFGQYMVQFSSIVAGKINSDAVTAAANAGKAMAEMANTLPNSGGVVQWFTGGNDMDQFGAQILKFGQAMVQFSAELSTGIDEKVMVETVNAANTVSKLVTNMPADASFDSFKSNLTKLAETMVDFSSKVSGKVDVYTTSGVAETAKLIAETAKAMPETVDLSKLQNGLVDMGKAIVDFSNEVSGKVNVEDVKSVADAGKSIASLAATLPEKVDLSKISIGLKDLGNAMQEFASSKSGIDDNSMNLMIGFGNSISAMLTSTGWSNANISTISDALPLLGKGIKSFYDNLLGDSGKFEMSSTDWKTITDAMTDLGNAMEALPMYTDVTDFNNSLPGLGTSLKTMASNVKGIDDEHFDKVIECLKELGDTFKNNLPKYTDVADFIRDMPSIGTGLKTFYTNAGCIDDVTMETATKALKELAKCFTDGTIPKYTDCKDFVDALPSIGESIAKFMNELKDVPAEEMTTKSDAFKSFSDAVTEMAKKATTGFADVFKKKENSDLIKNATSKLSEYATNGLQKEATYNGFYSIGQYIATGLINGIHSKAGEASSITAALVSGLILAANKTADINSPSRVFYEIGGYIGQGLINGVSAYNSKTYNAGSELANSVNDGVSKSLLDISNILDGGFDFDPVIRPTMDLSDIDRGARYISSAFDDYNFGFGIDTTSVNSVSRSMNTRSASTDLSDVVAAISGMRSDLSDMPRTSYNIGGINYNDDSAVGRAIETLVHAAKIERRR